MSTRLLACAAFVALWSFGSATQAQDRVVPADIQWKQILPGAHFGAAHGDWEKGAHGKYVRFVKGVQVPLHRHSNEYHAVILSGQVVNVFEGGQRVALAPYDYFYMAPMRAHAHECLSEGGCLFYTYGSQLWDFVPYQAPAVPVDGTERGR